MRKVNANPDIAPVMTAKDSKQAARYLGVSEGVLRLWRSQKTGPVYFTAGEKLVRYRQADLDRWVESRLVNPAAEEALAAG